MKLVPKIIILASFFLLAVFGFTAMNHGAAHCIVSAMVGSACPESLFGFADFHIGFFKSFSNAVFDGLGLFVLLAFGILLVAIAGLRVEADSASLSFVSLVNETDSQLSLIKKIRSWLSLLETSPTFHSAR